MHATATMDLLPYWNLSERPFEATWDRRYYFKTTAHEEALNRLGFLVAERSMNLGVLTGEIGSGKTLLRAIFVEQLEDAFEVVVHENSGFSFNDLLGAVLRGLGAEREAGNHSKIYRLERLRDEVEELHDERRHLVVVFDEAQEMNLATLNDLKLLTNLNGDGENFLTVILVGQPELRRRVSKVPSIDQRVGLRYHLSPLSLAETGQYLAHRLIVAGHPLGNLFTDGAVDVIFGAAGGIPREINRIAKLALELGWLKEQPVVTSGVVQGVVRDLERHQKLNAA